MQAKDFQKACDRTFTNIPSVNLTLQEEHLVRQAVGLTGEAGEVANYIKKGIFHRHGIDINKIEEELGDVLWYIAEIATSLELDLGVIMQKNVEKLLVRYPSGFTIEDSINRKK